MRKMRGHALKTQRLDHLFGSIRHLAMDEVPDDVIGEIFSHLNEIDSLIYSCCNRRARSLFRALFFSAAHLGLDPRDSPLQFTPAFLEDCIRKNYVTIIQWLVEDEGLLSIEHLLAEPLTEAIFSSSPETLAYFEKKGFDLCKKLTGYDIFEINPDLVRSFAERLSRNELSDLTPRETMAISAIHGSIFSVMRELYQLFSPSNLIVHELPLAPFWMFIVFR